MPQVYVYLAPGFEEVEAVTIADVLRRAGVTVQLVSLTEELAVKGAHDIVVQADLPFSKTVDKVVDAAILPGGGPGTQYMLKSQPLIDALGQFRFSDKPVAAICAAPMVLAKAGILNEVHATCFPGCEPQLTEGGAIVTAYNVVKDGAITTSRGPATAGLFALELARQLVGEDKATQVGRDMLYL
ncbi:DJ-1 family glyoxalase III [Chitinolyticbacter meiyuanensis]|uniref:DJ-1 family glyoxalase III n=1 Tax=Chitinolyticbacter meiyuanensis TaxID=682798 RepID=UPI0011E5E7C2|nr:DJ-1 family glyoxalase III [Chitinolyticbacter meiyuanensis]